MRNESLPTLKLNYFLYLVKPTNRPKVFREENLCILECLFVRGIIAGVGWLIYLKPYSKSSIINSNVR